MNEATAMLNEDQKRIQFPHHAVFAVKYRIYANTDAAVERYAQIVTDLLHEVPDIACDFIRDESHENPAPILEFGDCEVELVQVIQ